MANSQCRYNSNGDGVKICPVLAASKLLRSMWSLVVISYLLDGPKSFNELLRTVPRINSKTLSRTLKSLQEAGLVSREIVSTHPFSVKYSLTEMAIDLRPLLDYLRYWGGKWVIRLEDRSQSHDRGPTLKIREEVSENGIARARTKKSSRKI
ncbi:MAG: helix-turn-helix domain-containing protein [Nitrososphaerota archaeon]